MRIRALLVVCATVCLAPGPVRAAGEPIRLETPAKIDALQVVDVDGDGRADVVTLSSRTVCVWTSGPALPAPAPRWKVDLPDDVTFFDVARTLRPALLCLGTRGVRRVTLDGSPAFLEEATATAAPLDWRDGGKAVFARLHPGPPDDPTFLLPTARGWRLAGGPHGLAADAGVLPLALRREVTAAGPFLEDTSTLRASLPSLYAHGVRSPTAGAARNDPLWWVSGEALRCCGGPEDLAYDLAFLPGSGDRTLLDLDDDGVPDVIHRDGDNREGRYAFFRVPPPATVAKDGGTSAWKPAADLRPPAAYLRLAGFNLDPDYVDVDGDRLVDFVVTTMALDGPNIFRAVATGKVTATTLAFLQRRPAPGALMFPPQPDAVVTSEIGVKIRFAHTGTIDVSRSFTILATGDLDGDGRKDLVIRSGPATLEVRKGAADGVWAKDAATLAIPAVLPGEECEAAAANLDGKPGDEILLLYRGADAAPDRLYVLKP